MRHQAGVSIVLGLAVGLTLALTARAGMILYAPPVASGSAVIAFGHGSDLGNTQLSGGSYPYTPTAGSNILILGVEYDDNNGACTNPTATFGGTAMTRAVNTTRAQGGENPVADFNLINNSGFSAVG